MKKGKYVRQTERKVERKIDSVIYYIILGLLISLPLMQLIRMEIAGRGNMVLYYGFHCGYLLWIALPLLVFCYCILIFKYKEKIDIIDIVCFIMILIGLLSSVNAIDVETSFLGSIDRYEGFLTNVCYYMIVLCARRSLNRHNSLVLINVFLILGVFQSIYGFCQVFIRSGLFLTFVFPYMANALCGNPNYLGSYLLLTSLISLYFGIYSNKYNKLYLTSGFISMVGLVLAQSTIPYLTFIIGLISIFAYTFIKKKDLFKKCAWVTISALIASLFVAYISIPVMIDIYKDKPVANYTIKDDLTQIFYFFLPIDQHKYYYDGQDQVVRETIKNNSEATFYQGRLFIWKNTLKIAKRNLLLGIGYDNLSSEFSKENNIYIDKAHNHYLNILVTNGIFAVISYLVFITLLLIRGFKSKQLLSKLLSIIFISFIIHYFFSSSVLEVTPYFMMLCGVLLSTSKEDKEPDLIFIKE